MKSKLLVATLFAVAASSVAAQSSIQIYGRLNTTLERQNLNNVKSTELNDNSSRIGFKGTEDLGGGMNAGFVLEHGFNISNGTAGSSFWGRQSEVFVGSRLGTIRLGNFTSEAYYATADYISLHNHDTGTSSDALYGDTRGFMQSNKVGYMSPDLGGLVLHLATNTTNAGEPDRSYELAANYVAGAMHLGAAYQKTGDKNQFTVRGLYEIGDFTVGAYVQRDENIYANGNRNTVRLSGMYTLGATELHANIGRAGDYSGVNDSSADQLTVGVNHNLSKRTKVYTYYSKLQDSSAALYGADRSHLAVGLRHNF